MDNKINFLHTHRHKIKTWAIYLFILGLVVYLGTSMYSAYFAFQGGQCKEFFDTQTMDNKKRICCNPDQYNSKDNLCKIKCDTLEVNPESSYCQNLISSQEVSPLAKQIQKPTQIPNEEPKCTSMVITSSNGTTTLKPSNPITFQVTAKALDIKPKYFFYEFYSYQNNDLKTLKPISFVKGKTLLAASPAKISSDGTYKDSITALHEDLFQEDLLNNNKIPQNVLMAVSIIDQNDKKFLQPYSCFARFDIDKDASSCKSLKVDNELLSDGEKINLSLQSNLPKTYSYEFRFQNLDSKELVSFNRSNGKNLPFSVSKEANGNSTTNIELGWDDFYKEDLNNKKNYPQGIKVLAYVKPTADSNIDNINPCTVKFELDQDSGVENCKELNISGGTKNSDGSIFLKPTQYITLEGVAKNKNVEVFDFGFFNLDNLITNKDKSGVKNANAIYFTKSDPFVIEKKTSKTDTKSILVSYDDLNKIDLATGSKPKNIQARINFINSDDRSSKLNKNCVANFKLE